MLVNLLLIPSKIALVAYLVWNIPLTLVTLIVLVVLETLMVLVVLVTLMTLVSLLVMNFELTGSCSLMY